MNQTRNILLNLKSYIKSNDTIYIDMLLDNIKSELEAEKKDLEYQLQENKNNIELLKIIKMEVEKNEIISCWNNRKRCY